MSKALDPLQALGLAHTDPAAFEALSPAEQVAAARTQQVGVAGAPAVVAQKVYAPPPKEKREGFESLFARKVREAAQSRATREEKRVSDAQQEARDREAQRKAEAILRHYGMPEADKAFDELDAVQGQIEDYALVRKHMSDMHWAHRMADEQEVDERDYLRKTFGDKAAAAMGKMARRNASGKNPLDLWQGVANPDRNPAVTNPDGGLTGHGKSLLKQWDTWFEREHGSEGMPDAPPQYQVR